MTGECVKLVRTAAEMLKIVASNHRTEALLLVNGTYYDILSLCSTKQSNTEFTEVLKFESLQLFAVGLVPQESRRKVQKEQESTFKKQSSQPAV